jgi:chromosome segregation ATPase
VTRLEDVVTKKEVESEQARKQVLKSEQEMEELKGENAALVLEARDLKLMTEEAKRNTAKVEQEVTSLNNQRISYEKRSAQCIMEHLTEADNAKDKVSSLEIQVKSLEIAIAQEKTRNVKLKGEINDLKAKRSTVTKKAFPPPIVPPSPSRSYSQSRSESPSWANNKRSESPSWSKKNCQSAPNVVVVNTNNASPSPSVPNSPSGSVRALAACFEHKSALPPVEPEAVEPVAMQLPPNLSLSFRGPDVESLQNEIAHLENELDAAKGLNDLLQKKLHKQCEQVGELQAEVATLTATRTAIEALSRKDFDAQSQQAKDTITKLEAELAAARKQLETESAQVKRLKDEIRGITSERLSYEECTMEAYEKRAVTSQKTYQGELNTLKVELTKTQMKIADLEKEHSNQVKDFEQTIEDLNMECDKEVEEKQGELDMIKYKLDEQRGMAEKLQKEREQLCVQMNAMSNSRRDELQEIQADLMEQTTQNTSLQRALQSLQMQVEHQTDNTRELEELRSEVKKLKDRAGPTGTAMHKQQFNVEKLTGENRKLLEQVRNITMERRGLQERFNAVVSEQSVNRSVQVMRERNEKLKREVERLTKKLTMIEGSVSRIAI